MGCICFDSLTFLELSESIITDYHLYYNITLTMKIELETKQSLNLIKKGEKKMLKEVIKKIKCLMK